MVRKTWATILAGVTAAVALAVALVAAAGSHGATAAKSEVTGHYLEARTCQVYTGPCFANAEASLTGKEAMLAWSIDKGTHAGADLAGLKVVMVVRASDTLGFHGFDDASSLKSVLFVDEKASPEQAAALIDFARRHAGAAGKNVARVDKSGIEMSLDTSSLEGKLAAGDKVTLKTRKAKAGDCICSNEVAYYPPLVELENFAAGVAVDGEFRGTGLGSRWSIPGSRSVYMATFRY